jgi:hypothetical protein
MYVIQVLSMNLMFKIRFVNFPLNNLATSCSSNYISFYNITVIVQLVECKIMYTIHGIAFIMPTEYKTYLIKQFTPSFILGIWIITFMFMCVFVFYIIV